jgi:hypothetical protein
MVTVDAAIKKGRAQLLWTPFLVLVGSMGLFMALFFYLNSGDIIWVNVVCTFAVLFLPIAITLYYYSLMLPRWRIWAFSNVRNVHELKQRAILMQIYPGEKSFMWRLEIKSHAQKNILKHLEEKFQQPDIFEEDYSIPYQTTYSYPKAETVFLPFIAIGNLAIAVFAFYDREWLLGTVTLCGGLVVSRVAYKRIKARGPQLIISNEGITTQKHGFHAWRDIRNEQIFFVSAGHASYHGLSYEMNGETIKMSLKELTGLRSYKVDHVLRTYRGRYQRQQRQKV